MEDAASLQFSVEKAKIRWGSYLRDVMRGGSAGGQFEGYSGKGPSVVVQNAHGEKRVLLVAPNVTEARERAAAIENDYRVLGTAEWCARYNVPARFVTG